MIEYFNMLKKEEVGRFEKYLNSPFFNSNKSILILFEYLKPLYPEIKKENISKSVISSVVYGEKKMNDVKIRKLLSDFGILMESFLIRSAEDESSPGSRVLLLNALRERGMVKRFEKEYRDLSKSQKSSFSKDESFYNDQVNMLSEYYNFNLVNFKNSEAECLQMKSDLLDMKFLFSKLHTFYEMLDNEGSRNRGQYFNRTFYDELMEFTENNLAHIKDSHPNVFIIYHVLRMNETLKDDYLNTILTYLKSKHRKFSKKSLSHFYNYITSYYTTKINAGHIRYRQDLISVYMKMMKEELFLIDNIITDAEFNSVVNTALAEGEYRWVNRFIEHYREYLGKSFADDIYNLAKAKYYFHMSNYEKIFAHLNQVDIKDPTYYINSKFLLGRVYYERGETERVHYILDNLIQYKRNKKILSAEQQKSIVLYIRFMTELIKLSDIPGIEKDTKKLIKTQLRKEMSNSDGLIPGLNWFRSKLSTA
ncbi:MAG: hypothetical protein IPM96_20895 [Ignavibacteria bacterium]|nr:hypothetical protein [Ignavibacteria bacterium]